MDKQTGLRLHPDHLTDLQKSGLTDETIVKANIYSVPPHDFQSVFGSRLSQKIESAMAFPYPQNGFTRYKLFPPVPDNEGHTIRYFQPSGTPPHLYFHPADADLLIDSSRDLFVTEGEKKTLAAYQAGIRPTVGLGGVSAFKAKDSDNLLGEFDDIPLKGRSVFLIPDGDYHSNKDIQGAVLRFSEKLREREAITRLILLPATNGHRVGLDDFLVLHGIEEFWKLPREPITIPSLYVPVVPNLDFPRETIGGLAGRFAEVFSEYLESPYGFFVFDFLTCLGNLIGDRVTLASEIAPQPRQYTFTIGPSGDTRKSEAQKKTVKFFSDTFAKGEFNICQGVGSAEGLALKLAKIEQNPKRLLLVYDEAKAFVSKAKIEGSTLLPCVNSFFENNQFHSATKSHDIEIDNAYLSLLAASTRETFERMWTSDFLDIGFINRLWLVYDHAERRFSIPREVPSSDLEPLRKKLVEVLSGIPKGGFRLDIDEDAREIFDAWYLSDESHQSPLSKRLDTYGLRLMILLAVNEGASTISAQISENVIKLLQWQLQIRRECDVIDAESNVAKVEELIRRALSKGPSNPRALKQRVHYSRYGIYIFQLAIDNLQKGEEVFFDRKANLYCLR